MALGQRSYGRGAPAIRRNSKTRASMATSEHAGALGVKKLPAEWRHSLFCGVIGFDNRDPTPHPDRQRRQAAGNSSSWPAIHVELPLRQVAVPFVHVCAGSLCLGFQQRLVTRNIGCPKSPDFVQAEA